MIGTLSGAQIDVLRLRNALLPYGLSDPPKLVWSARGCKVVSPRPDAKVLNEILPDASGPLIELLIARYRQPELRTPMRSTVQDYRADATLALQTPGLSGMNWNGLSLGGKVDGGRRLQDCRRSMLSAQALRILEKVHQHLAPDTVDLLHELIIREQSRAQLAKRYSVRPSLMEQRARGAVRQLAEIYRLHAGRPG